MKVTIKHKIKEIAKHGVIYGVTSSLQNLVGFLMLPILTTYLNPEEFGIYSIILLSTSLAIAIFSFGAPSALGRFYFEEDDDLFRKQIISSAFFITILGSVILVFISILFSAKISVWLFGSVNFKIHIILAMLSAVFMFLSNILSLVLRYEKKSFLFTIVMLANATINFFITYFLLSKFAIGILAPLYGMLISNGLIFLFLLMFFINRITSKISRKHTLILLDFGFKASVTGLLYYLLDWVDRLILKDLLPMADVGIYSLGYKLGAILNVILITPFGLIWAPIRMQYSKNENNREFITTVFSYFTILGYSIILISILFGPAFIHFFFKNPGYYESREVFPIIMLAMLFFGFQNILDYGIYLQKKVHYYIIFSLIGLIFNISLNYLLIPYFGLISAAYVSLLTYLLTTILIYLKSNTYYKIKIEYGRIIWPLLFLHLVYFYANIFNPSLNIAFKIIILVFALILFLKFWLNEKETKQLKLFYKICV